MSLSTATPVDDDRRYERRLPLQMLVEYESTADFLVDYTANISIGGKRLGVGAQTAVMALDIRLVNTTTGEILMADNVRRGGELIAGAGSEPPRYAFATLYGLSRWADGAWQQDLTPMFCDSATALEL